MAHGNDDSPHFFGAGGRAFDPCEVEDVVVPAGDGLDEAIAGLRDGEVAVDVGMLVGSKLRYDRCWLA